MRSKIKALGFVTVLIPGSSFAATCVPVPVDPTPQEPGLGLAAVQGNQNTCTPLVSPLFGSPDSAQTAAVEGGFDLRDVQPEGQERFGAAGDTDTVGFAFTYWGAGSQKGQRYDLHYRHARNVFEGSRARLMIDVPVRLLHANRDKSLFGTTGGTALLATVNVGLELPVNRNWVVTPRVSYGFTTGSAALGGQGEIATGSINSRYRIPNIGRGEIIIGNSVAYTHTVKALTNDKVFAPTINWVFRNGIAFQYPLKARIQGRSASIRASYVFTTAAQDPLVYRDVHEFGLSLGVRSREAEQHASFEKLRLGVLFTHAKNQFFAGASYNAGTLTLGYRF